MKTPTFFSCISINQKWNVFMDDERIKLRLFLFSNSLISNIPYIKDSILSVPYLKNIPFLI